MSDNNREEEAKRLAEKQWDQLEPLVAHAYIHAFGHGYEEGKLGGFREIIAWIEQKGFQVTSQEVAAYLHGRLMPS